MLNLDLSSKLQPTKRTTSWAYTQRFPMDIQLKLHLFLLQKSFLVISLIILFPKIARKASHTLSSHSLWTQSGTQFFDLFPWYFLNSLLSTPHGLTLGIHCFLSDWLQLSLWTGSMSITFPTCQRYFPNWELIISFLNVTANHFREKKSQNSLAYHMVPFILNYVQIAGVAVFHFQLSYNQGSFLQNRAAECCFMSPCFTHAHLWVTLHLSISHNFSWSRRHFKHYSLFQQGAFPCWLSYVSLEGDAVLHSL